MSELKLRPPNAEERSPCSLAGLKPGVYDLSSGAEARCYVRLTWELKLPPPKEKGKGARDGPRPLHRPTIEKQRRPAEAGRYVLTCSRTRAGAACRALTWKEKQVPRAKTALGMTIFQMDRPKRASRIWVAASKEGIKTMVERAR